MKKKISKFIWWLKYRNKDPKEIRLHPTLGFQIEYQFTINGVHYYQLANDYDMPKDRFKYVRTYYQQLELKFTAETLAKFMDKLMSVADEGKLSKVFEIAKEVKYRSEWLFEPESLYRLYSVITFDLQENIEDYDLAYNEKKIEAFKKKDILKKILQELMSESETLLNLSEQDFQSYISQLNDNLKKQSTLIS